MGRAGFAKIAITPPLGVEFAGYGVYLRRRATAVHDALYARALVIEGDAGERVLLLSLDLIGLSWDLDHAIALAAADAVRLTPDRVLVSCTHTHSGPATLPMEGWGEIDPAYVARLPALCATAAAAATADLQPVVIGAGEGVIRSLGFNRVRAGGPIDRGLDVLRVERTDGTPLCVLFSHGCHPVTIDRRTPGGTAISADWPGQVSARLREEGGGEAMFRLGVCGDVDPVVAWHDFAFAGMELSGELVTQSLIRTLQSVQTAPTLTLALARRNIALPLAPLGEDEIAAVMAAAQSDYGTVRVTDAGAKDPGWPRFFEAWAAAMRRQVAAMPEQLAVPVAALRVNDAAWLHLPGEVFSSLGARIKARSPFAVTVITTLFGPFIGYLPDEDDFASGGYAATLVPKILQTPPYAPAVGDSLVEGAVALLTQLHDGGK